MSPTYNFVISPIVSTHQFCDKNREIKLATPRKRTGTSAAGVVRPNHHATKGNCLMYLIVLCNYQIQDSNHIHILNRTGADTSHKQSGSQSILFQLIYLLQISTQGLAKNHYPSPTVSKYTPATPAPHPHFPSFCKRQNEDTPHILPCYIPPTLFPHNV